MAVSVFLSTVFYNTLSWNVTNFERSEIDTSLKTKFAENDKTKDRTKKKVMD